MKRAGLIVQCLFAVFFTGVLALLWFKMITDGDDAWFGWRRSFSLAGMFFSMYVFLLANVFAIPVAVVCSWSAMQRLGWLPYRAGVRFAANLLTSMSVTCLLIVGAYFNAWDLFSTGSVDSRPKPPSDASLEYPELPLPPPEAFAWTVTGMDGSTVDLAALKGKTVFLNIWATWCGFCILEFPNLERLREAFKDDPNVVFLFVTDEPAETVRAWQAGDGKEFTLPFYTTEKFPSRFTPRGYPTTYMIAPDGQVAFSHSGFVAWDGDTTKDFLRRLSSTTPATS